jgi:hypothetical protein
MVMRVLLWTDSDCFAGTERHCCDLADGLRQLARLWPRGFSLLEAQLNYWMQAVFRWRRLAVFKS